MNSQVNSNACNALSEAENMRRRYESPARDLAAHPEKRNGARWYKDITAAYSGMLWNRRVERTVEWINELWKE